MGLKTIKAVFGYVFVIKNCLVCRMIVLFTSAHTYEPKQGEVTVGRSLPTPPCPPPSSPTNIFSKVLRNVFFSDLLTILSYLVSFFRFSPSKKIFFGSWSGYTGNAQEIEPRIFGLRIELALQQFFSKGDKKISVVYFCEILKRSVPRA